MSHISVIGELDHKIQRAKASLFTGVLAVGIEQDVEWFLYFLVGQIVWANARTHSNRRWYRQFIKHSSELDQQVFNEIAYQTQSYKAVAQLVMQQKFSREHFAQIVRGCISEILFDIIHGAILKSKHSETSLIYKVSQRNGANFPCIGLQREPIWDQVQQDWESWQNANLIGYRPNLSPTIVQSDLLQERTSASAFQTLKNLANGQQTLRDLAIKTKQPLVSLTQLLVPHIRRDLIKLVHVDDLAVNAHRPQQCSCSKLSPGNNFFVNGSPSHNASKLENHSNLQKVKKNGPVVVYVDDNRADSQTMGEIFQGSGYQYVNIADPLQALPTLIELKPQLIFLDLVMPVVNGYELCAQIRRISLLKEVPVIIMTNNNGLPDRVRAKVVGATGFLGKPIKAKQVLKVAIKYLQPAPVALPSPTHFHRLSPSV